VENRKKLKIKTRTRSEVSVMSGESVESVLMEEKKGYGGKVLQKRNERVRE